MIEASGNSDAFSIPETQNQNFITLVSGLPRSGTSLMMKMLQAAGYDLLIDNIRQKDHSNPNGYFEYEPVKNLKTGSNEWLKEAPGRVVKVVSPLLQYLPQEYSYKIIFMKRDLSEVLVSQTKMLGETLKASSSEEETLLKKAYTEHLAKVDGWMSQQPNIQLLYVNYNQLLSAPRGVLELLAGFLDKPLVAEHLLKVIDPNLYRNRRIDV